MIWLIIIAAIIIFLSTNKTPVEAPSVLALPSDLTKVIPYVEKEPEYISHVPEPTSFMSFFTRASVRNIEQQREILKIPATEQPAEEPVTTSVLGIVLGVDQQIHIGKAELELIY